MKPRVLVLTSTFPGREGDGVPPFVLDLCRRLDAEFDLVVVTPRIAGAPLRQRIGGITVERFAYFPARFEAVATGATLANLRAEPWRLPEFLCLLARFHLESRRAVRRHEPDLIHAHWLLPTGVHAAAAAQAERIPTLVTVHGVDVHALAIGPVEAVRRWALRRTNRVVAVSSALVDRVRDLAPGASIDLVPMGANLAEVPTEFCRAPRPGLVGFVGRLAEKKGVAVLLQALATVPELSAVVAGDGPERSALEAEAAALGIDDRVEFLGHAARRDVYELLATCEMLAIPSVVARDGDQEGTPVVLAEAVALGVPVVASRLGGIGDNLDDDCGWLVDPGDAGALATALAAAHDDPVERERRATSARKLVSPNLTLDGTAAAYATIYQELLS